MAPRGKSKLERIFSTAWTNYGTGDVPERDYQFLPKRKLEFDFAWPEYLVAIEIQGGTWTTSGHSTGKGIQRDCEKNNLAVAMGWRLLTFTGDDIEQRTGKCVGQVAYLIRQSKAETNQHT